ncbi:unnamed protein product [Microthlaspi erraticum]|uniref:Arabidopsis retrotransposon Orf1 C-terminal domain-containing protein n=1 Tax=Microthlaspi erraticum TaxID=1685480 RepID=A0A6D2KDH6_9BRAS|nr:unnamed protein product [Microthlaspi erraticum]
MQHFRTLLDMRLPGHVTPTEARCRRFASTRHRRDVPKPRDPPTHVPAVRVLPEGDLPFPCHLEHDLRPEQTTPDGSDGYITFWATGRRHYLSYRDIDRVLFLPSGNRLGLDVDRDEMPSLWGTIAFGDYFSSSAKSAQIRSPPVRYFHKAIANTLFSRQATGNVTETEMAMIDVALTGIPLRLINGTELRGSRTIRHKCTLRMGGLVTPLLRAVGFTPDREDEVAPPEWLDLEYLRNSVFLQKTSDASRLLYQFTHVQLGVSRMLLPSPSWTTIRGGTNVEFNPPQSALYTEIARPPETTPHLRRPHTAAIQSHELDTMQTDELDHFHFAGTPPLPDRPPAEGGSPAHQHSSAVEQGAGQDHQQAEEQGEEDG